MQKRERTRLWFYLLTAISLGCSTSSYAASFTYDGQLDDAGRPADGAYDIQLTAWAAAEGGNLLNPTVSFPGVQVSAGRFRLEFGVPLQVQEQAWLELAVRDAGSTQPYSLIGTRTKAISAPLIGQCWSATGDVGANPAIHFLGTTDAQPLVLRSNNVTGFRLLPAVSSVVSVVGGAAANSVGPTVIGGFVGGGGTPTATENNRVFDDFGTLPGGRSNTVGISDAATTNQRFATVGGGVNNLASAEAALVAGGTDNQATGFRATTGGGGFNIASNSGATVAGGQNNRSTGVQATVSGGLNNLASGEQSTIAGGRDHIASGRGAAVGGGERNIATGANATIGGGTDNRATGDLATVVGGVSNTASNLRSTVGGGLSNCAGGIHSWAGGTGARVRTGTSDVSGTTCAAVTSSGDSSGDEGSFVWADFPGGPFETRGPNQFLVRASGGMGLNTGDIPAFAELVIANKNSSSLLVELFMRSNSGLGMALRVEPAASGTSANTYFTTFDGVNFTDRLTINGNGDLIATANAFKPNGGSWAASSDARLKSDVQPLAGALDRLLRLNGVTYRYTHPDPAKRPAGTHIGLIAQEVQKVFPDWVASDSEGYLTVGSQGMEALTVEALRELQAETAVLQAEKDLEIAALKADNQALRTRLERIEQALLALSNRDAR